MDPGPEAAGGRSVTECRAAGDEETLGHGSADPKQRQIGQAGPPVPKPGCSAGTSWEGSVLPLLQKDRRRAGRQAHVHHTGRTSPIFH